jgi:hypothetical protein
MRLRAGAAALLVAAASVAPVVAIPTLACAQSGPRAVLVVDTGSQVLRYCVALDDEPVSGTDLIVLASRQYGLSYRFGYGGGAVCMLAGVGTTGDDCFEEYPDFWGYWRGDGSGGWTWSSTGAASTTVSSGDVEGWSWGSGNDGSTHPAPPSTGFDAVCPKPPKPRPDREEAIEKKPAEIDASAASPAPSPVTPHEEDQESERRRTKPDRTRPVSRRQERRDSGRVSPGTDDVVTYTQPSPGSSPRPIAATPSSGSGPPAAGLAGVGAAVLLAAVAIVVRRRSRPASAGGR